MPIHDKVPLQGAVRLTGDKPRVSIADSSFRNNSVPTSLYYCHPPGALQCSGVSVKSCGDRDCKKPNVCDRCFGAGGAISMSTDSKATVNSTTFNENVADFYGAGISMDGTSSLGCTQCNITGNVDGTNENSNIVGGSPQPIYMCLHGYGFGCSGTVTHVLLSKSG